jgi:hypothetical protein
VESPRDYSNRTERAHAFIIFAAIGAEQNDGLSRIGEGDTVAESR